MRRWVGSRLSKPHTYVHRQGRGGREGGAGKGGVRGGWSLPESLIGNSELGATLTHTHLKTHTQRKKLASDRQ